MIRDRLDTDDPSQSGQVDSRLCSLAIRRSDGSLERAV